MGAAMSYNTIQMSFRVYIILYILIVVHFVYNLS